MELVVTDNDIRLDKYLALNTDYSREYISKMLDNGFILVNDKIVKASYKIKEGDKIILDESFKEDTDIVPTKMDLDIVYEDQDVIVVNKPSGLTVHPGSGNYTNTLVNGLMYHTKELSDIGGEERPGIVHRIDKDTSGLLLIAKNNKAHSVLSDDFKNKKVKRKYIALINGVFPHNTATIDAPIGRDKNNRQKMTVTEENSKNAVTHLTVLKRYKKHTLISLLLETGRTHQIRVHMEYIGYPIFNDPVYSKNQATEFGQFLHSSEMDFIHPIRKEEMHFEASLPKEFKEFINELEQEIE
ncbi:MAG: RluA family pseudouridine synthase [Bacilli bacterium]|nr:RluA family pseudouridine synthase [Bacilli bacterium]